MFVLGVLAAAADAAMSDELSRIGVSGRFFVDEHGRARIFHGFNDVGDKTERRGPFNGSNYLPQLLINNETRLEILANEYGFNCFRIGAIWAAVQPEENSTDNAYLAAVKNATRVLATYGVYAILDMHQDALSTRNGWSDHDGAPMWLMNRTQPRHPYPWPSKPGSNPGEASEAVGQAFEDIYKDTHGGLQAWAAAWKSLASSFKDESSVVAYELMNEPFAGDVYKNPLLLDPAYAGKHSLQPAYDVVAKAIRGVDNQTVIMYEPVTWGMIYATHNTSISLGSGFSHVPGGEQFANRSAYSFHYYCWDGRSKSPDGPYDPSSKAACQGTDGFGHKVFASVDETISTLGGASFLTEWGGVYFTPGIKSPANSTATEEAVWIMDKADEQLQSWNHWDLMFFFSGANDDGFTGCSPGSYKCIKEFIRPYAQAIAGAPVRMRYNHESGVFTLVMRPDGTIKAPTEIFLPPYRYPSGYHVRIEPAAAPFTWAVCPGYANKLCVFAKAGTAATKISTLLVVTISPAAAHPSYVNV